MTNGKRLQKGDLVKLKSGGPKMTVAGRSAHGSGLICEWFDEDNEPQSRVYDPEVLEKLED